MVEVACHRCGYEWNYTGGSDHYGCCPNCKTSVKLEGGSERAEPEAERCPDPSDRPAESVEIEAGGEAREVSFVEAVEALDRSVSELYQLEDDRTGTVSQLAESADDRDAQLDDLREGLQELAGYFAEFIESFDGGEVEYKHIEQSGDPIPEALEDVDMEGLAA